MQIFLVKGELPVMEMKGENPWVERKADFPARPSLRGGRELLPYPKRDVSGSERLTKTEQKI